MKVLTVLNGYKTYLLAIIGIILVALQHAGVQIPGVHLDDNVAWQALVAAALRHGIANS